MVNGSASLIFKFLQNNVFMFNLHTFSNRKMPRQYKGIILNLIRKNSIDATHERRTFRVTIEGNISSGKTTLINYFQMHSNIDTYTEPIENWRNVNGNNLLELLYTDIKRWNFLFQNYVQLTRFKTQLIPPSSSNITVQIYERSLQNNRYCFVEMAYLHDYLSKPEYSVLVNWFDELIKIADVSSDLIVYIRTKPETCFERMRTRARPEENPVSLKYLKQLHDIHEKWLLSKDSNPGANVLVLNGDKHIEELQKEYENYSEIIMGNKPVDPLTKNYIIYRN